jgi:antitoxin component of MazEF toxin-antitoxin module
MAKQKIIRTGNSLAVTIPSFLAKSVGIKAGQGVLVKIEPDKGKMICSFSGNTQLSLINKRK